MPRRRLTEQGAFGIQIKRLTLHFPVETQRQEQGEGTRNKWGHDEPEKVKGLYAIKSLLLNAFFKINLRFDSIFTFILQSTSKNESD